MSHTNAKVFSELRHLLRILWHNHYSAQKTHFSIFFHFWPISNAAPDSLLYVLFLQEAKAREGGGALQTRYSYNSYGVINPGVHFALTEELRSLSTIAAFRACFP